MSVSPRWRDQESRRRCTYLRSASIGYKLWKCSAALLATVSLQESVCNAPERQILTCHHSQRLRGLSDVDMDRSPALPCIISRLLLPNLMQELGIHAMMWSVSSILSPPRTIDLPLNV